MGVVLVLVVLSPFALSVLDRISENDWQRLSAIGETYGAVSALLAAIALGAVVVSIHQQRRSAQVDREHVYRTVHLELTRMLLDHPDLMGSYTSVIGASTQVDQRLNLYCNQEVLALEMGYEIGALGESYIAGAAKEMFGSPASWRWWAEVRGRKREMAGATEHRVFDILDREWRRTRPEEDPQRESSPDTSIVDGTPVAGKTVQRDADTGVAPPDQQMTRRVNFRGVAVLCVAGVGALITLLWLQRQRNRRIVH